MRRLPGRLLASLTLAGLAGTQTSATAADLLVQVSGIQEARGLIGCALFRSARGFPMDNAGAEQTWMPVSASGVQCRIQAVPPGHYAVAVSQDLDGNRKLDTNFLGIPTEPWGVSNNVRPTLRAPRWDEAVFEMPDGRDLTIDIKVAR